MWRLLLVGMLSVGVMGCPKSGGGVSSGASLAALAGDWTDEGGTKVAIKDKGGSPMVVKIVDSDGEVFPVTSQGWTNGKFGWTYNVPSTGYNVSIVVESMMGADVVQTSWTNDHGMSGMEKMFRDR